MKYFYLFILFIGSGATSQENWDDFTGRERAFLFHQARRTEVLKPELFHLFEYTDSIPYINDTLPDYRYVESQIVQYPSSLILHSKESGRKSDGLWSDLAVRFALWELDQVLQYRNSTAEEDKPLKERLKLFEKYVLENISQSAVRTLNNGDYVVEKTIAGYYAPSLTVSDKLASIINAGYSQIDQMLIINAIMLAQEKYVDVRAKEVFKALGGENDGFKSYLSAVGDGSNWADVTGGFNTPYTVGLPDEKGLFRFTIEEVLNEETEKKYLKVNDIWEKQFTTNSDKETVVHLDVFGYHPERQTTIAIQKGGNSYVLYGKNDHRLVSPDSTYGEGTTYWRLMYRLEHYYIANLKEDLYGKRGYEYQIDLYENKIEKTKLQIKETEYRLDKLRHTPEGKPKMKKKKIKKKNLGMSDQDGKGHPTSKLSKLDKKKNIEQNRLLQLNGLLDGQKAILAKLKEDMEKAYINLVKYETRLDLMKKNMGYIIMEYEEVNGIYTFKDGARFNYATQDFVFPPDKGEEAFKLHHISFGEKVFDEKIEENFSHVHVSRRFVDEKYTLKRIVADAGNTNLTPSDSIQIMELFTYLTKKKIKVNLTVNAGGIMGEKNGKYFRDSTLKPQPFDADAKRGSGVCIYDAFWNGSMNLSVTAYEPSMLPGSFETFRGDFEKLKTANPGIDELDFYAGVKAKYAAANWVEILKGLVSKWIKDSGEQKIILSRLKKIKPKTVQFVNGSFSARVPDLMP